MLTVSSLIYFALCGVFCDTIQFALQSAKQKLCMSRYSLLHKGKDVSELRQCKFTFMRVTLYLPQKTVG